MSWFLVFVFLRRRTETVGNKWCKCLNFFSLAGSYFIYVHTCSKFEDNLRCCCICDFQGHVCGIYCLVQQGGTYLIDLDESYFTFCVHTTFPRNCSFFQQSSTLGEFLQKESGNTLYYWQYRTTCHESEFFSFNTIL